MILKSSERAGAASLANHLTNSHENERVSVLSARHILTADSVHEALRDMEAIAGGSNCQKHMHHVMLNPNQPLNEDQWAKAWATYEAEFDLADQPYIEVEHHKEGRTHRHRVYDRIRENEPALSFSFSRMKNEKISRILEHEFGHELTIGKHNKAVMAELEKAGMGHVVQWMEKGRAHEVDRPIAEKDHTDHQIEKRTGLSKAEAEKTIRLAWDSSDSGKSLKTALELDGLKLARGNRRDFVVLDSAGTVHSLGRRVGEKAKIVRNRMADLDPETLPDVDQAREMQLDLARSHEQAVAEPHHAPPEPDKSASEKRRRKQEIKAKLEQRSEQEKKLDAERHRQQQIEQRKQLEAARRRAAEKARILKEQLQQNPDKTPSIMRRARATIGKAVGWMKGLALFGRTPPPPAQDKAADMQKQAGDAVEITQKSEQQRQPTRKPERQKSRRQIIDLDAEIEAARQSGKQPEKLQRGIRTERGKMMEEREKKLGKDKGRGLERTRDKGGDTSGNSGEDDPFG